MKIFSGELASPELHHIRITWISYNMGTSALPDMYARSPRAAGPWAANSNALGHD